MFHLRLCLLLFTVLCLPHAQANTCESILPVYPREIDPQQTFDSLVDWIYIDLIQTRKAPGFVIGISGTDSILAFLAMAKAFERAGRPERVVGIHFGRPLPAQAELQDPVTRDEFWFQLEMIPWLKTKAPGAQLQIDHSIDHRRDGLRWGALMEYSVTADPQTGLLRAPSERYWVSGTHNATEEALLTYSNLSNAVSVQPIQHLWKSEVLKICEFLGVPKTAMERSCQADCACGRDLLPATYIPEVDALLMVRQNKLSPDYVQATIPVTLRKQLQDYIEQQILDTSFKTQIPYRSQTAAIVHEQEQSVMLDQQNLLSKKLASQLAAEFIQNENPNQAAYFASTHRNEALLPESLVLFNVPRLRVSQVKAMIESLFDLADLNAGDARRLGHLNASLGNYGFSFPQWRFWTQRFHHKPSLAEQFGMKRLTRLNDLRDGSLPDPERDEWGVGFQISDENWYLEYRRAYILISHKGSRPATLLIRNNSHYFGRDRLAEPVFVSTENIDFEKLEQLDSRTLSSFFTPWQTYLQKSDSKKIGSSIRPLMDLISKLDEFNRDFATWILDQSPQGGFAKWIEFLNHKASERTPIYVGVVAESQPSWKPSYVQAVTPLFVHKLAQSQNPAEFLGLLNVPQSRLVLLSGAQGDLP